MTPKIVTVHTLAEIETLEQLAKEIWREHFTSLIGESQVEYMLEKFQSSEAVRAQIKAGSEYFMGFIGNEAVGYFGLNPDIDIKKTMLSKIYVKSDARGSGVGSVFLEFVENWCRSVGMETLWLSVNRFNSDSVDWYQQHGFVIVDEVKKDIGNGFILDDYIMEKILQNCQTIH